MLGLGGFAIFYVGLYLWGSHSEGYQYLTQVVRESDEIRQRVGDVQSIRLSFIHGYREKFVISESRSSKTVAMTLRVFGSRGTVSVEAVARQSNGAWSVSTASIDGHSVKLNTAN